MDYNNYDRGYAEPSMSASDYMTRTYPAGMAGLACSSPFAMPISRRLRPLSIWSAIPFTSCYHR